MKYQDVIDFWFTKTLPKQWFIKDAKFDKKVRTQFLKIYEQVSKGEMEAWRTSAQGRLAEIIVLDQFSRNMFRGKPESFATDALALVLAQEAIRSRADKKLSKIEKHFLYMPFMHSESKALHKKALQLFKALGEPSGLEYEILHKKIIDEFGRYPHRNEILGRKSTKAEREFLKSNAGF